MKLCLKALLVGTAAMGGLGIASATTPVPSDLTAQLSYPFLDNLVAAERGGRIAWTSNTAGIRTVWTAAGPDYRPRSVATTGKDDGQELTGLTLSPDGQAMAWTRGGDHDGNWEAKNGLQPNPGSPTTQPQLEIWYARANGPAAKLAEGDAPALSANGRLAFLKDGAVWTVPTAGKGKAERLFFDRGKDADLAWSPDGRRLLFTSNRGDHGFVGVWSGADKPILWLAPSTGHDSNPAWSPDGSHVAFSRTAGDGGAPEPLLQEVPHPWSLWVADATSGEGQRVWASPRDLNGSYPEVPGGLYLRWAAGDRLLFRAEMDGWPHLYAVPAAGGNATLLTPGAYMVDRPSLSPDRQSVLFDANTGAQPGDEDRRHVMRVAVDRPGAIPLTRGDGIESGAVAAGAQVAFLSATATRPASLHLMQGDGAGDRAIDGNAASYSVSRLIVPKPVTFRAADGLLVHGQLFAAPGGGTKPGVIFVHGGPPRQMLLGWSYMDYYSNAYAVNQYLAAHGFVVLSVNYRLGIGYGRAYQHPAYGGPAGSSEYQDVVAGARFLQRQPGVDGNRIGIWGGSYGGLLTALALARNSDLFKAGVDFHGVHDWSRAIAEEQAPPKRYERGDWDRFLKVAFDSSPVASVSGWRSPVLFIHGDDDRNVHFNQTIDLERRLDALGRPYEELIFPDEIHGFLRSADWLRADAATIDFLQRNLQR
jgi:dipeptidyl aminopeptidase/acylaminoacyl peptidase